MSIAIVTGSAGLIGAEAVRQFAGKGLTVIGIDNDLRRRFFGFRDQDPDRAGEVVYSSRLCLFAPHSPAVRPAITQ